MTEARFVELLAAYGADLARWPEKDRAAAEALLDTAPHRIKDIWESERVFDRLLALEKDMPAPVSLEGLRYRRPASPRWSFHQASRNQASRLRVLGRQDLSRLPTATGHCWCIQVTPACCRHSE